MIKKQQKSILDHLANSREPSPQNSLFTQTTVKFNCDQLINDYLHFSLSGEMKDHLGTTKKWMKNNKKQAKIAVRKAEKELQKSMEQKTRPIKQFFESGSKNMNVLIMSKPINITSKMFNEQQMQKILTEREKSEQKCQKKIDHLKNIDNYLQQISRLNYRTAKGSKDKQNCNSNNSTRKKLRVRTIASLCKRTEENAIEQKEGDLGDFKSLNSSSCMQKKSELTTKKVMLQVNTDTSYHPFLEKNLTMLYESKKKNYLSKKFRLNKHKVSIYY